MSETNYFLDTNAIIALLNRNQTIRSATVQENWLGVSVINIIEFLSFGNLTLNDKNLFITFLQRVSVINPSYQIDIDIINLTSQLRISYKLKLPDAIIATSAIANNAILITNDKQFSTIPNLQILSF